MFEFSRDEGRVTPALVIAMRDTLIHRGPDGDGHYVTEDRTLGLGHRRLAIVDIAGGAQPMFGPSGACLVFNGEIYNYPQLRRELEGAGVVFRSGCDTEVILHLYERYGDDCVHHLTGMFSFVLWDPGRERLFFARDPIGEKPFYWAQIDGTFVCASEIKALLKHPAITPAVQTDAIPSFLSNLVTAGPQTLYKDIQKLPPGTMGWCDRQGVQVRRYWSVFEPRQWTLDTNEAAREVRRLLDVSVHDRLMSDVPVGVLLSGGIDSTTLVALLHERARGLSTFSVGFCDDPAIDERAEARRVAERFGTDHHEVVVSEQDALNFFPRLIHHQDEPLGDPVCIPVHFVSQLAREHGVPVVLAGEGADEAFWGYPKYRRIMAQRRWISPLLRLPGPARRALSTAVSPARHAQLRELLDRVADGRLSPMHYPLGLTRRQRVELIGPAGYRDGWTGRRVNPDLGPVDQLAFDTQEYEFGVRLPELLLMRIDRFSMANSVEARVPFLDPALVKFVYRLPLALKLHNGQTKVVLRQAIADIVPQYVLDRPKQGFGAPISRWFATRMGTMFESLLDGEALLRYFDTDALRRILFAHTSGDPRHEFTLWPILNFALWHRYWIEDEPLDDLLERSLAVPAR